MGEWLKVRGYEPGPLLCPISQIGKITVRRMTDQAIYAILQTRAKTANIRPFSPHDLRRSCVSDLLDAGVDISIVQQFVGHANVNTTARYDRRGEHAKKRAAKSCMSLRRPLNFQWLRARGIEGYSPLTMNGDPNLMATPT